jgi:hypothetical protein
MRCDLAQGFYFSRPLGAEAAGTLVATNPSWGCPDKVTLVAARPRKRPTPDVGHNLRVLVYLTPGWGGASAPRKNHGLH